MTSAQPIQDFNSLPKELRDMIWDAAVRDDRPAAHFFSLFRQWDDLDGDDLDVDDDCVVYGFNDTPARKKLHYLDGRIAAPTADRKAENVFSWTTNNPSTYLQDGGLWTACRESRAAMERSQKKRVWGVVSCLPRSEYCLVTINNHRSTSGYFSNDGVRQYFAIGRNDLVCFQPVDFGLFVSVDGIPFFSRSSRNPTLLQHFAFEFDSHWTYPEDLPRSKYCWEQDGILGDVATATIWGGRHIWFIDYGIQRDTSLPNNTAIRDNRQVFYGTTCRYVEVQASDPEWSYPRLEGSNMPGRTTALYFSKQLNEAMIMYDRIEEYLDTTYDSPFAEDIFDEEIDARTRGAILGVLACEYK